MNKVGTPGGNRLRAMREYYGKTQLEVELDANLGIGYLQRMESGKVRHPERDTLERILSALPAHYTERRDILELFGYIVDAPLPNEEEIQWAVTVCHSDLQSAVLPAYLLDCAHRLLAWNRFVPGLLGLEIPTEMTSMLRLLFDPAYHFTPLIANPDVFFPAQIRVLRYEKRLFHGESWCDALIHDLLLDCPLFEHYWTGFSAGQKNDHIAARPLIPLELRLPNSSILRFRLTSEPFAQDRRFRVIYYIPADTATIQHSTVWLEANVHQYRVKSRG